MQNLRCQVYPVGNSVFVNKKLGGGILYAASVFQVETDCAGQVAAFFFVVVQKRPQDPGDIILFNVLIFNSQQQTVYSEIIVKTVGKRNRAALLQSPDGGSLPIALIDAADAFGKLSYTGKKAFFAGKPLPQVRKKILGCAVHLICGVGTQNDNDLFIRGKDGCPFLAVFQSCPDFLNQFSCFLIRLGGRIPDTQGADGVAVTGFKMIVGERNYIQILAVRKKNRVFKGVADGMLLFVFLDNVGAERPCDFLQVCAPAKGKQRKIIFFAEIDADLRYFRKVFAYVQNDAGCLCMPD